MTISSRVQQQFFTATPDSTTREGVIRLPPTLLDQIDYWSMAPRGAAPSSLHATYTHGCTTMKLNNAPQRRSNLWTAQEHDRFLRGLELFPCGPWKRISAVVRTKTTRQTMTHAQKYRQKIERHMRLTKTFMHAVAGRSARPVGLTIEQKFTHGISVKPSEIESFRGSLEFDAALAALIASLEPIDNPDAWSMPEIAVADDADFENVVDREDPYGGAFDVSFLDQEFDAMLRSLELPLSAMKQETTVFPSYGDELGVFSV